MRGALLVNRVVLWTLVAAIGLPPTPATAAGPSGKWSRVTALKPDTQVVVTLVGPPGPIQESVEGYHVSADSGGLVVGVIRSDLRAVDVTIPRDRVAQVAIVTEGRQWYRIPLVVGAVIGGAIIAVGVLWLTSKFGSGWPSDDDSEYGFLSVFALPVLAGIWAYRRTEGGEPSLKVIYKAPRPKGAGMAVGETRVLR